jgi:alpha-ketoglutarate-dependent taurine dioxygenase
MADANQLKPVEHPSAWRAGDCDKSTFAVDLSERHLAALDRALQSAKRHTDDPEAVTREQFALDDIAEDVDAWRAQVMDGYGLIILRGFPVDRYSKDELGMMHFGLGTHFGTAMSQSVMGDRLGHVVNVGGKDPKERAYRNSTELDMHTDACDVVAMMCLQKAASGGYSGYVSAVSIYNEVLRRAPELMPVLMAGYHYHRFGEEEPGQSPVTEEKIPVFSFHEGYLSVNYLRAYIDMAADEMEQPLSEEETAALDLVDEIAHDDDLALRFITEPGEAVFFNNLTMLHNRTAFEDADAPEAKRHFLRLWLVAHQPRPACDALRIYEGRGISKQEGKSTYFDSDRRFSRFERDDSRM